MIRPISIGAADSVVCERKAVMKYSVLIPAYNCADTIADTIESIRKSGLHDYEIIVVNDGGVSSARNTGIGHAKGEYLLFADADDTVTENAFCHITEIIEQHRPDMLAFGMQFDYYYKKTCYRREQMICPESGLLNAGEIKPLLLRLFQCNYLTPIWNKFIRRELIREHQIRFAETMMVMEDCLFSLECLQNCRTVYLSDEVIYHYSLSESDRRLASRLRRAGNLYEYIEHFSCLRAEYAPIVRKIYYMLLCQRIRIDRTIAQLRSEASDLQKSRFGTDLADAPALLRQLQAKRYGYILFRTMKSRIRHRIAVLYKTLRSKWRGLSSI